MTGPGGDSRPPELPPPPLADYERPAGQPLQFPDGPLPWGAVLGGLVGGLAQGPLSILRVYLLQKLYSSTMLAPLTGLFAAVHVLTAPATGVVLALLFVVVDRRARGTGRPLKWALAGAVPGLALTLSVLATSPGVWTVGRLTAAMSYIAYLLVPFALLGLVFGLFARWRHHPALAFAVAVAGAITSGLSLLLSPIMATLTSIPSGFPSLVAAAPAWQAAWLTIATTLADGAVYGACFGAAIAGAERRKA